MPESVAREPVSRSVRGLILSLGFWFALVSSGVIFSAVSLGPKWIAHVTLQRTYVLGQGELVGLQRDVHELERVARAFEREARGAGKVTAARKGNRQQVIPLEVSLQHDARLPVGREERLTWSDPWYLSLLERLNANRRTQVQAAMVAAGLFLFSFVFYHEKTGAPALGGVLLHPVRRVFRRYASLRDSRSSTNTD